MNDPEILLGLSKCPKLHVTAGESVEDAVGHITRKLRSLGEREVTSRQIGEIVMEELHKLDEVAYVRYASVYRHFQDVEAFRDEVELNRARQAGRIHLASISRSSSPIPF